MKKILLCLMLLFLLVGCTKPSLSSKNYKKINYNMTLEEVTNILGEYDEVKIMTPGAFMNTYFYFSKGETLEEAKELTKNGEKIYFVELILNNKLQVIGKLDGYVTLDLQAGDVAIYA